MIRKKEHKHYGRITSIRIPVDLWELLKEEANHNFTSIASVVVKAIAFYYESQGKYKR